jgi:hypothetical protein
LMRFDIKFVVQPSFIPGVAYGRTMAPETRGGAMRGEAADTHMALLSLVAPQAA